jgi:hypothetical protein
LVARHGTERVLDGWVPMVTRITETLRSWVV